MIGWRSGECRSPRAAAPGESSACLRARRRGSASTLAKMVNGKASCSARGKLDECPRLTCKALLRGGEALRHTQTKKTRLQCLQRMTTSPLHRHTNKPLLSWSRAERPA